MISSIEIFNSRGELREISDDEIAALPPERRERLSRLVATARASQTAERELRESNAAVTEAAKAFHDATERLSALRPKRDFHSLWLETFGSAS